MRTTSAMVNSSPATYVDSFSFPSTTSSISASCSLLCFKTSGSLNLSSVSYTSSNLRWYEPAKSGDWAILAITTRLMNFETTNRYFSGMWNRVKYLGSHACILCINSITSWLLRVTFSLPKVKTAILSMYLQQCISIQDFQSYSIWICLQTIQGWMPCATTANSFQIFRIFFFSFVLD